MLGAFCGDRLSAKVNEKHPTTINENCAFGSQPQPGFILWYNVDEKDVSPSFITFQKLVRNMIIRPRHLSVTYLIYMQLSQ